MVQRRNKRQKLVELEPLVFQGFQLFFSLI